MSRSDHRLLSAYVSSGVLKIQNGFPCGEWNDKGVGVLHLRPFNISDGGQIDLSSSKFVQTEKKLDNYLLRDGDVVFNNTNSEELVGKTSYWSRPERSVLSNHMTILRVLNHEELEPQFLAFFLLQKWFERHFEAVCRRHVNQASVSTDRLGALELPPYDVTEQKQIAHILSTVQRAIGAQERIIQTTTELKKTLMHKLFTEGLRNEPQKQTEIGPVPESWEVVPLEQIAESFQYGTSVKCAYDVKGKPVLRIPNVVGGAVAITDLKFGKPKPNEIDNLRLQSGDLLFVRTNGVKENAGRCSLFEDEIEDCYFASYLIRVRLDPRRLNPTFLNEYSRTEIGTSFLSGKAIRTADGKFNINAGTLKTMLVPVPAIDEQEEIARALALMEAKSSSARAKKSALQDLFRTLLHQLMTGEIRVQDAHVREHETER